MRFISHPSFFRACKAIRQFADYVVTGALAPRHASGKRYVFLHGLAKEVRDPIQLWDHALSILTAGRDTTAELLSCAINILVKHPEAVSRLRGEIAQLEGRQPSFENLKEIVYLRNVILEVLRLYPIGPANARIATKDTTLLVGGGPDGGLPIMIEKVQQVIYCVWGMHRRKDLYGSDAASFRSGKWEIRKQGGWEFLPFNGGARQCIGQSLAITEASYILVRFLQEFGNIEARELRPWQENLELILSNFHDTLVDLTRHKGLEMKG
ncbi:cytochrome P450 [Acephala macrosclerotiorum]|nr:cytochrome P450 [Acephala macrosclerotiorum]